MSLGWVAFPFQDHMLSRVQEYLKSGPQIAEGHQTVQRDQLRLHTIS